MSVRPVNFNPDGSIDVINEELGHTGTISTDQIVWNQKLDGTHDHNFIVLNCPDGCGTTSTWPVGGGADAINGQQMFVNKTALEGCACGVIEPQDNSGAPDAHVRLNCNRMDGPGRWQLDTGSVRSEVDSPFPSTKENSEKMFQVVYREADSLIVGLEPNGGVGPNNRVAVIHDMAEYEILCRTDPAYLSADGDHIVAEPPV